MAGPENASAASDRPSSGVTRGPNGVTGPLRDQLLRLIWEHHHISRAEIARQTGLSRSTVSDVVGRLIKTELVDETGAGPSSGGRRPIVLEFQDEACVVLGVEMGAAHVAVALTDLRGRVLAWESHAHAVRDDPPGTRRLIRRLCDQALARTSHGTDRLVGIGVAVPCPLDPAAPDRLSEVVLPAWKGRSGLARVFEPYGVPFLVDNDANLGALAENWWGAGRGVDDFAYVKIGTGVGSGHVVAGEVYRGATGVAGEIGHLAIDPSGDRCICGLRGCLATFVGAPALVARARKRLDGFPDSVLASGTITIDSIEEAALAGDPLAVDVAREAAEYLGIAIAGLLNLMNPSAVILGGGLSRLGDLLLEPMRETVRRRTLVSSLAASEIRAAELGPKAIAIGAATLILKTALEDVERFPAVTRGVEVSA